MTAFLLFLLMQNLALSAVVALLCYRLLQGHWPRKGRPAVPFTPVETSIPTVEEALPGVLERLQSNPPTPDYPLWTKERKERFARELAQKGRSMMTK